MLLSNIIFTLNAVLPTFALIFLGAFLNKINILTTDLSENALKLVFYFTLPLLIFIKISSIQITSLINIKQLIFCSSATIIFYILIWLFARIFISNKPTLGAFIQGAFRSNYAIFGLPFMYGLFGEPGFIHAAIVLIAVLLTNNVLAIIALSIPKKTISLNTLLFNIIKNPLVISPIIGIIFSVFSIPIPSIFAKTCNLIGSISIPLSLLIIGGSLKFNKFQSNLRLTSIATLIKMIIIPLLGTYVAIQFGFSGIELGAIYFLFAAPTAVASYVMADAMDCNSELASYIVLLTTITSVFTISIGIFLLRMLGYL